MVNHSLKQTTTRPTESSAKQTASRPPIVTVLGHVDHGKTTLLDTIRKTNITTKEYGGITQHIGAYQIGLEIPSDKSLKKTKKKITFIDTPGHQAFAKMRSRGAKVSDLAILVVAANDGVMPQTIESVTHIKEAGIPCIVAINKIDLPDLNVDKIKKQLVKLGLELEEYGGETPVIPLSAKTGQGVDKLLEMILLLAELNQVKEDTPGKLKAIVIESTLSKNRGPTATIIVRSGNLTVGDEVICENQEFRIRALTNWLRQNLNRVEASEPAEIIGWKSVPLVGSLLYKKNQVELARPIRKDIEQQPKHVSLTLPSETQVVTQSKIKLIIKADTAGTLEAILGSISDKVIIIASAAGNITESDIFLAKTTGALVIGFHIKPRDGVLKLAETEKVIIKTYNVIYDLIEEIDEVIEAALHGDLATVLGEAKIIANFHIKDQIVAGVKIIKGRIARGDQIKVTRGETVIARARIKSLRHGKEDINRAEQGTEAGVLLSQKIDFLTGDSIISIG